MTQKGMCTSLATFFLPLPSLPFHALIDDERRGTKDTKARLTDALVSFRDVLFSPGVNK